MLLHLRTCSMVSAFEGLESRNEQHYAVQPFPSIDFSWAPYASQDVESVNVDGHR